MNIGRLSPFFTKKILLVFFLQFLLVVTFLGYKRWNTTSIECMRCHADQAKMAQLGYPQFYVTQEMIEKAGKHPNVKCHECHLGNGRAKDKDKAHKGMLTALYIGHDGNVIPRKSISSQALLPSGDDKIREMLPQVLEGGTLVPHPEVKNVLWHDRNPKSLDFDPDIAKKTCGTSNCHPDQFSQFKTTHMGTNHRQRTMRTWIEPYGPHNCGPSFADQQVKDALREAGFAFKNTEAIAKDLAVPFTKDQAAAKQKFCNVCHTGCLDCHYAPDRKNGSHHFVAKPPSQSCGGYGRGTNICHPGAMQSRRGETYIGGDYSIPTGMAPDVHYTKNIQCVDCHATGEKGMGDMQRKATCQDCHVEIEDAHKKSIHKNLDCATCHISELRGYQITMWGPGKVAGKQNPFKKYSLYYGIQSPPILLKDQKGKWMPVKVWPHSVGNIAREVKPSGKVLFRWPNGETRDAYFVMGTFDAPANSKQLLWLELQQAAHPYGKARSCQSCHKDRQVTTSRWEFMDDQGAEEPFKGGYTIVADEKGLRIQDMKATTPIKVAEGYKLEDFAAWVHFKDKWNIPGDFSIKVEKNKYKSYQTSAHQIDRELRALESRISPHDKKTKRKFSDLKGAVLHNQDGAQELLQQFKNTTLSK